MGQGGAVGGQAGDPTALSGTMGPFSDASMLLSASSLHSGRLCIPAFSDLLSQTCFLSPCFPSGHPPSSLGCLYMVRQGPSHRENDRKGCDSAFSFIAVY